MSKAFSKRLKIALSNLLMAFSEVSTDKGVIYYDAEELAEGVEAYLVAEDGEKVVAEDGDYIKEDGTVIGIVDGKVASIVVPEEVPAEESVPAETEEELKKKKCGLEDEQPVVEEEKPDEVKEEEPASEEAPKEETEDLKAAIEALRAEIETLKERLVKIEETPAAEPVAEEFSKAVKSANTKDDHLEFLKKMASGK